MEIFSTKEDCCGCTACASICTKNAIKMAKDEEGAMIRICGVLMLCVMEYHLLSYGKSIYPRCGRSMDQT